MLVTAGGESYATIGGGRVEFEVFRAAVEVARSGQARRVQHHLVRDLAMCCGGSMEFYIEPVAPSAPALERVLEDWNARRPVLLITPLDGTPKHALPMHDDMGWSATCRDDCFLEPLWPRDRLILFGAGHVSRAVGPIAAGIGLEVIVCDDDDTGALSELDTSSWVTRTVESFDIRDVQGEIGPLGASDFALIMTRDHAVDQAILERLLPDGALGYLGLIGSHGKIGRFRKRLHAKGLVTEDRWARLHAPIGLDIGAETPGEIAVAVMAELIQFRHARRTPAHEPWPEVRERDPESTGAETADRVEEHAS